MGAQQRHGSCPNRQAYPAREGPQGMVLAQPWNLRDIWPVLKALQGPSGCQLSLPKLHSLVSESFSDDEASADKLASILQNTHLVTVSEKTSLS